MSTIEDQKRIVDVFCRQFKSAPWQTMSQWQAKSPVDAPARGGIWISRTKFRAPVETHLRDALYHVCERLKIADQKITPSQQIPLTDVGVEFIGCRSGVDNNAPEPEISEQDKLQALESEWKGDLTILYVHGGGLLYASIQPEDLLVS